MKKNNYIFTYPAIFNKEAGKSKDSYNVSFPDFPTCFTCGDDIPEACSRAEEVLSLYIESFIIDLNKSIDDLPKPSDPINIRVEKDSFLSLVKVDMKDFFAKNRNKSVKKTLTIPEWLNIAAESKGINFSATLQEALKEKLGV